MEETNDRKELISGLPNDVAIECLIRVPFNQISTAASVCKDWNAQIQLPEFWRHRRASGFSRPLIAMAQSKPKNPDQNGRIENAGLSDYQITVFDPVGGCWFDLPPPPVPGLAKLPLFCRIVGVGRSLVVMGGFHPVTWKTLSSVSIYDFSTASWRNGADIPGGERSFFGCASDCESRVLIAGGHDGSKNALSSAMVYDVAGDEWTVLPEMARERDECKCVFRRGRFHSICGYCTERQGCFERSSEALDLDTWRWDQQSEGVNAILEGVDPREDPRKWETLSGELLPGQEIVCLMEWSGKLFVIGAERSSGSLCAYGMDLAGDRVLAGIQIPQEHSGHVQSSCFLEI